MKNWPVFKTAATAVIVILLLYIAGQSPADGTVPLSSPTPTETATLTPDLAPTATQTPTATPAPTATPTAAPWWLDDWALEEFGPEHEINCDDGVLESGYRLSWAQDFCVPGLITYDAWHYRSPSQYWGALSSYDYGVMEYMVEKAGLPSTTRGAAVPSCAMYGSTLYIRAEPGGYWHGPFVVVDCSMREHSYYHHVIQNLAVEISRADAERIFGARALSYVEVSVGGTPNGWDGTRLGSWWVRYVLEFEDVATGDE